jgi:predicted ATPase
VIKPKLKRIVLKGFKSIQTLDLQVQSLNVLIGANGAGKSNLVSFFKMINEMMGGRLQQCIAASGRSQSILHFGPKITPQMEAQLEFNVENGSDTYYMRLFHAAGDTLVFAEETLVFQQLGWPNPQHHSLGAGHLESRISEEANEGVSIAKVLRHLLNQCRVYHFHDTSATARVRQAGYKGDNRWLMPDAGNLAAMLYRLKNEEDRTAYQRIVETIRLIVPFFEDFELEPAPPNRQDILLNWRHRRTDQIFGPHQLSDGTLRAISLISLLLQPEDELPDLIIVDEPELGLHPYALTVIASLFKRAAQHTQLLISTQSSSFLDSFDAGEIVVVEREGQESRFTRPTPSALEAWLDEYSLGEVWEKNVIGGGPH